MQIIKMENKIKIISMIVLLFIIGFTFGYIYSLKVESEQINKINYMKEDSNQLIIINHEKEVSSLNTIISDKYVGDLKDGYSTIVVGKDGSLINVYQGVILTNGLVVESNSGETQSIYRIDFPQKSISVE